VKVAECRAIGLGNSEYSAINCRKHSATLTDFGGVGDGKTSNTKIFATAIANLTQHASDGGATLIVPSGKWLTGPFNLTSHFTLFLQKDAVILASQVYPRPTIFSLLLESIEKSNIILYYNHNIHISVLDLHSSWILYPGLLTILPETKQFMIDIILLFHPVFALYCTTS